MHVFFVLCLSVLLDEARCVLFKERTLNTCDLGACHSSEVHYSPPESAKNDGLPSENVSPDPLSGAPGDGGQERNYKSSYAQLGGRGCKAMIFVLGLGDEAVGVGRNSYPMLRNSPSGPDIEHRLKIGPPAGLRPAGGPL